MAGPCFVRVACAACVLAVVVASTDAPGNAQAPRGGPKDWSHSHVIASRFGPDADENIRKNWRTYMKHVRLDRARAVRNPMADWLEQRLGRPVGKKTASEEPHLDWNLRTGGTGSVLGYPAKYSFDISASNCSDVIYFAVTHGGAAGRPNLIAITQPYAGCLPDNPTGATPKVKWGMAMPAGTATSPVPSLDGKVLYAIESAAGSVVLHAVNVDNITANPGTYNFGTNGWSGARDLAAPTLLPGSEQLFEITFTGVTNNVSSPYLDYETNQMFFGDSAGYVHRIANVHTAGAARDTTNFPVRCGTAELQSPVYWQGQIIVTSANGILYRIDTTLPPPYTCIPSMQAGLGTTAGGGLSAPVLDVTNNKVIVTSNNSNIYNDRGIGAFDLMFAAGAAPASYTFVGPAATTIAPVAPALDEAFWSTNNGNLYIPGSSSGGGRTYLNRIPYNGNLGAIAGNASLTHTGTHALVATSPVTEFLTSAASNPDYVFIGGGSGTYRYVNRISAGFGGTDGTPVAMTSSFTPQNGNGVLSGIIIDTRTLAMTGSTATANIYFGTVGAGGTQSQIIQLAQGF